MDICSSPQLIAAYHVFLRLLVPRHPPCALFSLTILYGRLQLSLVFRPLPSVAAFGLFYSLFLDVWLITSINNTFYYLTSVIFIIYSIYSFQCSVGVSTEWRWWDSNSWPPACKAGALPTELHPQMVCGFYFILMGLNGLEPSTSRLSGVRSNQLSYKPI